jgi:hypothetical protein
MSQDIVQYCQRCGKPLDAQARFCGSCGTQIPYKKTEPRPIPQQPSAPMNLQSHTPPPVSSQPPAFQQPPETILSALPPGDLRSGFLGMRTQSLVLVLTNARILVAKQTSELMKENARVAKESAKQSGKGFFGQWGAVMGSSASQRYLQMQPQTILNETVGNYYIVNNQVRSAKVKENYDPETSQSEVKLILDIPGNKIEIIYRQANKKEIKQALQQTLGSLVR